MNRIIKIGSPEDIGLTLNQIKSRSLVALGYCEEEILPPYSTDLHEIRAQKVLELIQNKRCRKYRVISDITVDLTEFDKIVELVGAQANFCIEQGIEDLISKNVWAYVNPDLIFTSPKTYSPFTTGKILLQEYFFETQDQPHRRCYKLNGALIFGTTKMAEK